MVEEKLATVGFVPSEYVGAVSAAASVVAILPAASPINPADISTLSGVFVEPRPSAAKPTVPSKAVAAASVSVIVNTVALVTTAEVTSDTANVTPALSAEPSRSQTILDQSSPALASVPALAIVVKFEPAKII